MAAVGEIPTPEDAAAEAEAIRSVQESAKARAAEFAVEDIPAVEAPPKLNKEQRTGPPNLDEWQDFIGRIVLRTLCDGYITLMLKDFESELSDREREMIRLTKEDLHDMAAPFASLANKSKLARKHGRTIVAAADSYEAGIVLIMWMRRVNRIAKKHRAEKVAHATPPTIAPVIPLGDNGGTVRENAGTGNRPNPGPGNGGTPPITILNPGTG